MRDVMLDLETLGTKPGSVILSIGAVVFDRHSLELGREFYCAIDMASSINAGLTVDESTAAWWRKQNETAQRAAFMDPHAVHVVEAFHSFRVWFQSYPGSDAYVWGNGADFDIGLMNAAYANKRISEQGAPWKYNHARCFRTLCDMAQDSNINMERLGTFHNALDDAKTQARHAAKLFMWLQEKGV